MSFDIINHTLSADVADNGTFTVSYPTGASAGTYTGGHAHELYVNMALFHAPKDFTLTFGASSITVTWKADTTLAAGTSLAIQVDKYGSDDRATQDVLPARVEQAPVHIISLGSPATADPNGVCESQSVTTTATLDGVLVSGGVATFDVPRNVVAGWTTSAVITVTGTDEFGNTLKESSGSGTTFTGKKAFKTVTGVAFSTAVTGATVGTGDVLGLPVRLPDAAYILGELQDGVPLLCKSMTAELFGRVLCTDGTYGVVNSPVAGTIKSIVTNEIDGGITTNNAVLTFKIGTNAITNGVVTIATSGSAAGVLDSATPTAANAVAIGDAINVTVSGTPGAGKSAAVAILVERTAAQQLDGTFVAAVDTAATATTGDVRGTYDPTAACDGAKAFALLVTLPDPTDRGVPQYAG